MSPISDKTKSAQVSVKCCKCGWKTRRVRPADYALCEAFGYCQCGARMVPVTGKAGWPKGRGRV